MLDSVRRRRRLAYDARHANDARHIAAYEPQRSPTIFALHGTVRGTRGEILRAWPTINGGFSNAQPLRIRAASTGSLTPMTIRLSVAM